MKSKSLLFYSIALVLLINHTTAWYESSKCTITQTDSTNSNENDEDDLVSSNARVNSEAKVLKLSCSNNNLIFVAWSHYGQHLKRHEATLNKSDECYFSPRDCMVSVDYVANECNGLSSCLINLDSQYLHSCKSYSDYLFIIYDCIEVKSTVNVCDAQASLDTALLASQTNQDSISTAIYLQTPNYPNEYLSNLDCNCTLRTTTTSMQSFLNPLEFEMLEFDLESTASSVEIHNTNANVKSSNLCTKDYFSITNKNESQSTRLCGTFSPFLNLNHHQAKNQQISETNLRFFSDDALTRRGFWIKVKSSQFNECPENFILIDNTCVRVFSNEMLTWYEAQSFCSEKGYSLAIIDNFELDKQINRALFGSANADQDENESSLMKLNRKEMSNLNKFWTGIRHLNETNWFDYKNELIRFKHDEHKWFPWLVVDSSTYNIGSCVAKRQNWLYLEDCYKRMPFACQYKPKQLNKLAKKTRIQLKCGKNVNFLSEVLKMKPVSTTSLATAAQAEATSSQSLPPLILVHQSNEIVDNQLMNETSLSGISKQSVIEDHKTASNNSTLLISLISSITLLIAFINSIVILVICKRRKLLLQNNSEKDSKLSSHDTISSSGHNINFDEMTTSAGTNSSSSLTFSTRNLTKNTLFMPPNSEPIFIDSTNATNANNFRRSIFVNNKTLQPQQVNRNDPLGHIYETISVSSSSSNLANAANMSRFNTTNQSNYNLFNHYHLHQQQQQQQHHHQQNTYNEPELNVNTNNMILMNDSELIMNKKLFKPINHGTQPNRYTNKVLSPVATNFRPVSNQKQLATIGTNRFSDLNISNSNSSSSPSSSTTTTLTDVLNQSNLLNSSSGTNKNFILINNNNNSNQMIQPTNNRHLLLCSSNDLLLQQQQQQQQLQNSLIQTFARNSFKNGNHFIQNLDKQHIQHIQSAQNNKSRNNLLIQQPISGPLNFITNPVEAIV